jgi:hypothetical protein
MRYTKKDADGNYYIESKNGALWSDIKGRTYGPAIDLLALFENKEEVPPLRVAQIEQDIFSEKPMMKKETWSGGGFGI